jgi:hypothetical protein
MIRGHILASAWALKMADCRDFVPPSGHKSRLDGQILVYNLAPWVENILCSLYMLLLKYDQRLHVGIRLGLEDG